MLVQKEMKQQKVQVKTARDAMTSLHLKIVHFAWNCANGFHLLIYIKPLLRNSKISEKTDSELIVCWVILDMFFWNHNNKQMTKLHNKFV